VPGNILPDGRSNCLIGGGGTGADDGEAAAVDEGKEGAMVVSMFERTSGGRFTTRLTRCGSGWGVSGGGNYTEDAYSG